MERQQPNIQSLLRPPSSVFLALRQFSEFLVSSLPAATHLLRNTQRWHQASIYRRIHINFIFNRHQNGYFHHLECYSAAICCTPCMEKISFSHIFLFSISTCIFSNYSHLLSLDDLNLSTTYEIFVRIFCAYKCEC